MKINLIGMILNNCGRRVFEGAIIDTNGDPMEKTQRECADAIRTRSTARVEVRDSASSRRVPLERRVGRQNVTTE